jgi:hypothetical protein
MKRKQTETKRFDTSTIDGLKAAERYQWRLYSKYNNVTVATLGLNRVEITGRNPQ